MRLRRCLLVAAVAALAGTACAQPRMKARRPPAPAERAKAAATPVERSTETARNVAVFLIVHPDNDAAALATILESEPRLKLTLILPAGYFDAVRHQEAASRFKVLQSSRQVEIALSLENEPILPLIADFSFAGQAARRWDIDFSWPEDVAAQVARGSGAYQRRWAALPSGLYPPYGSGSEKVIDVLRRFRLDWVLLSPADVWGVKFFGGTAVLTPPALPLGDETQPAAKTAEEMAREVLSRPYSLVDAGLWPSPDHEIRFVRALAAAAGTTPFETGAAFVGQLKNELALPAGEDPFDRDFSPWVRSPLQKRAWQALADARKVIENYKNSGRANLTRLDAAIEEICVAESGPFLLSLGSPQGGTALGQRNFLATIASIYRLAGVPVPSHLNGWFAVRSVQRHATSVPTDNDRPFFVEGPQRLIWSDPKGDDNGPGTYSYPAGAGPKGLFDLREFSISWTHTHVTISIETAEAADSGAPLLPAADVYIDVNRIAGAGASSLLGQRGEGSVQPDAAWEYVATLTPQSATLFQGLPNGERIIETQPARRSDRAFIATFPRSALRGDPEQWRLTVALGATEASRRDGPPAFLPITPVATPKSFGGAAGPRPAPRYIDVLAPSASDYDAGSARLPYVEAE